MYKITEREIREIVKESLKKIFDKGIKDQYKIGFDADGYAHIEDK